jgi:hypothetical protein
MIIRINYLFINTLSLILGDKNVFGNLSIGCLKFRWVMELGR